MVKEALKSKDPVMIKNVRDAQARILNGMLLSFQYALVMHEDNKCLFDVDKTCFQYDLEEILFDVKKIKHQQIIQIHAEANVLSSNVEDLLYRYWSQSPEEVRKDPEFKTEWDEFNNKLYDGWGQMDELYSLYMKQYDAEVRPDECAELDVEVSKLVDVEEETVLTTLQPRLM